MITRRAFLTATAAFAATNRLFAEEAENGRGIRVRFLGSGAAGWNPETLKAHPHARRQSSVLLENKVLIDFTRCSFDLLPEGIHPEVLFQTHSHGDHYNPEAAVKVGVKQVYVQESWAEAARLEIGEAAKRLALPAPEVIALPFGKAVEVCGMRFTGVPANHSTSRVTNGVLERTSLYLVEKGAARLLYATDTGGIPGDAARMIGIDPHITGNNEKRFEANPYVAKPQALTALIMEATNGILDEDFRLFVHSSVQAVDRTVKMLAKNGRFLPPPGQHALLTHLGLRYRNWPSEKIDAELPDTLRAAHDGLEVVIG
ncbi:MAG: MBL fold metallo-hydrolase [Kiritimatiellae bacterium]|nr:MBL fold metallo-hydrolase [Kiritimatiellia bacterium]